MTVKELKHMLENADDDAVVVVRNNWAPAEFLNPQDGAQHPC